MTMRIFIAGILGGVVMFIWTSIAHMALPLGEIGVQQLPNESAIVESLRANLGDRRGLYIFPGSGLGPNASADAKREAMKQMDQKVNSGPSGILMYHPRRSF